MSDAINHVKLAKLIRQVWVRINRLSVSVDSSHVLFSDGFAIYKVERGSKTIERLPGDLTAKLFQLPNGDHEIDRKRDATSFARVSEVWSKETDPERRGPELYRRSILADVPTGEFARYYTPRIWINNKYDECIVSDSDTRPLYYLTESEAMVVEAKDGPVACIMPMVGYAEKVTPLFEDYAEQAVTS
jgi:hypothetical protein